MTIDKLEVLKRYATHIKECKDNGCPTCKLYAEIMETTFSNDQEEILKQGYETRTALFRGVDYNVNGMGKHIIKFQITDGATDFHCTYKSPKRGR
jgi:hypothetical protein